MNKETKYVVLKFNMNNKNLLSFFDDLFSCNRFEKEGYLIYQLDALKINKDYELASLVDLIKVDFNEDVKIFESCVFKDDEESLFDVIFDLYKKYVSKEYMNMSSLCMNIFEKDGRSKDLYIIRNIVVNIMKEENDLFTIAKAMYKNNLNVSKSANDAYMHRNTAINKLNVIKNKTGLNIQNFQDAFILYLFMTYKN